MMTCDSGLLFFGHPVLNCLYVIQEKWSLTPALPVLATFRPFGYFFAAAGGPKSELWSSFWLPF